MSKHQTPDEFDELNNGTYRTGRVPRQQGSSGLIALLLVLTIFLGGLASALGLLNIRLLHQLMEEPKASVPVNAATNPSASLPATPILDELELPMPQLPEFTSQELQLQDLPDRSIPESVDAQAILERNADSLVTVQCGTQQGTGIVLTRDGCILTNAHLLQTGAKYFVTTRDGKHYRAALVGYDVLTDLAVLYIEGADLVPASFGNSDQLMEDDLIASGSSYLSQNTLAAGSVSQARRSVTLGPYRLRLMQTTIGSSAGPVFSSTGQILGINSMQVSQFFGLYIQSEKGYALPSTTMLQVAQQILEHGCVAGRPTLGIRTQAISKVYQQYWNLPGGLRLLEVSESAQAQGLQEGDILLSLEGRRLMENADLYEVLFTQEIGQTITAVLFRDGETITLQLIILDVAG